MIHVYNLVKKEGSSKTFESLLSVALGALFRLVVVKLHLYFATIVEPAGTLGVNTKLCP